MMLRPTIQSENSSRGNTAYGESSGYFDPGADVRGDCARITLYIYTRWGNTDRMWGKSGVVESLEVLLKWMEEDPVDTWEMGRNDAVQSITGVRNVFVDYPEYAWLLFGKEIPVDMVTPSGKAATMPPPPVETTTPPTTQATEPTPPPTQAPTQPVTTIPPETTAPTTQPTVPPTETTTPPTTQATGPATQPTNPTTQPTAPTTQPTNPAVTAPVTPPADTEHVGAGSVWVWIVIAVVLMGGAVTVFVIWKKKLPPFHK